MDKSNAVNTVKEIRETIDLFYQQKSNDALKQFEFVLGKMVSMIDEIFQYRNENPDYEIDENKITSILNDAMNAMEEKDYILLADIIQYDFIEYIEELLANIK